MINGNFCFRHIEIFHRPDRVKEFPYTIALQAHIGKQMGTSGKDVQLCACLFQMTQIIGSTGLERDIVGIFVVQGLHKLCHDLIHCAGNAHRLK